MLSARVSSCFLQYTHDVPGIAITEPMEVSGEGGGRSWLSMAQDSPWDIQHEPERVDEEVALARGGPHIAAEQVIYQVPNPVCAPGRQIMGQQSAS